MWRLESECLNQSGRAVETSRVQFQLLPRFFFKRTCCSKMCEKSKHLVTEGSKKLSLCYAAIKGQCVDLGQKIMGGGGTSGKVMDFGSKDSAFTSL